MPFFPKDFSDILLSFLAFTSFHSVQFALYSSSKKHLSVPFFVLAICLLVSIFCFAFPVNLHISSAVSLFPSFQRGFFIVVSFFKFFLHR